MRNFINIVTEKRPALNEGWSFLRELESLNEVAPSGKKAEHFIKHAKKDFKKRYGKNWKKVLYATAWKNFGESAENISDNNIVEDAPYKIPAHYGWWITNTGDMLDVGKFQHEKVAQEWLKTNTDYKITPYSEVTGYMIDDLGWVRVVNEKNILGMMVRQNGIAPKAVKTAGYIIDDLLGDRTFVIEFLGVGAETFDSHNAKNAIALLRKNVLRSQPVVA